MGRVKMTSSYQGFFVGVVLLVFGLSVAQASGSTGSEIAGLPILDSLNRTESPLSNSGKWSALKWDNSTSGTNTGRDTTSGWGPSDAYPTVNGAYWNPVTFSDSGVGDAAEITMKSSPSNASRYVALWLDMPSPGTTQSGYQLSWVENSGLTTYTVTLSRWSSGSNTVLATNSAVSIAAGTTMAISDTGGTVQAWEGTSSSLSSILSASDSTYSSGYVGVEASGNFSRSVNFQAGVLLGEAIANVPILDGLRRQEVPLATGKWSKSSWAGEIGGAWDVTGIYLGFGASNSTTVAGAYWNPATFSDAGGGDMVAATVGSGAPSEGEYMALWLDMPAPASARSGYEARFTGATGGYTLELSKWVSGTRTVLASSVKVSIPVGTTVALTEISGGLTMWTGTSSFSPVLLANDSTYTSGYAGLEVYGAAGTENNFRAGALFPPAPTVSSSTPASGNDNTPLIQGTAAAGSTVKLYINSACTGTPAATASAEAFASPGIEVSVADNTTTTFYATAAYGTSASPCSSSSVSYKENTPTSTTLEGVSLQDALNRSEIPLSNGGKWSALSWDTSATSKTGQDTTGGWGPINAFPEVYGAYWNPTTFSDSGFGDATETTMQTGPELSERYIALWLNMPSPGSVRSGYELTWTQSATFNVYSVALLKWTSGSSTVLASNSSVTIPVGTTMVIADTGGVLEAWKGSGGTFSQLLFAVDATYNSGYSGIEAAGNFSRSINFRSGSLNLVPAKPTVSSVSPASPANNNSPKILGSAEASSTVSLYTNSSCSGSPTASGTASSFASPGIAVSVTDNTTTTFYATASNSNGASPCSTTSITYTEDSTAPAAPTVSSVSPTSPANNNSPKILGSAESGSTVKLYTNSSCTSSVAASGSASSFSAPGLTVSVTDNSTTSFYATATDTAGNTSSCSTTTVSYQEDSTPPAAPTLSSTNPASGSNNNSPKILGSAESGSTVKLYPNSACTGTPAATGTASSYASPGLIVNVTDNTTTTFYATATDASSNVSSCSTSSISYREFSPTMYWGAWVKNSTGEPPFKMTAQSVFETNVGQTASLIHWSSPFASQAFCNNSGVYYCEFQTNEFETIRSHGSIPFFSWAPGGVSGSDKQIAEGSEDSYIEKWALAAKNWGHPFFLRFAWEMNASWFRWGQGHHKEEEISKGVKTGKTIEFDNTAEDYAQMWRHIYGIFAAVGVTNVTWVWCPNIDISGTEYASMGPLYPGNEYVDWTCLDGYNWDSPWTSFNSLFTGSYSNITSTIAPSKPMVIGETASTESGGSKSEWITSMFTSLASSYPKVHGLLWFDKINEGPGDWPIESSTTATTAFANGIQNGPFAPANYSGLNTSPIPATP